MKLINTGKTGTLAIRAEIFDGHSPGFSSIYEEESVSGVIVTIDLASLNRLRGKAKSFSESLNGRDVMLDVADMIDVAFVLEDEDTGQEEVVELKYLRNEGATISFIGGREKIALEYRRPHIPDDYWNLTFDVKGAIFSHSISQGDVSEQLVAEAIHYLDSPSEFGSDIWLALIMNPESPDFIFNSDDSHNHISSMYRDAILNSRELNPGVFKKIEQYGGEAALKALGENPHYAKYRESQAIGDYRGEISSELNSPANFK